MKGINTMQDDFLFTDEETIGQFDDFLNDKGSFRRDKIISVISNFDFDRFRRASEWVNLFIDDSDYPVFRKKTNSVEVKLIYTSCRDGILEDIDFTLEVFVYDRTAITCKDKPPALCFLIAKAISTDFLESVRPVKNNFERKSKKTRRLKNDVLYGPKPVASI
jgi:hypothetical protein